MNLYPKAKYQPMWQRQINSLANQLSEIVKKGKSPNVKDAQKTAKLLGKVILILADHYEFNWLLVRKKLLDETPSIWASEFGQGLLKVLDNFWARYEPEYIALKKTQIAFWDWQKLRKKRRRKILWLLDGVKNGSIKF